MKRKLRNLREQEERAKSHYDTVLGKGMDGEDESYDYIPDPDTPKDKIKGDRKIDIPKGTEKDYAGINGDGPTLIGPSQDQLAAGMSPQLVEQGNQICNNGGAYMTLEACPNSLHWTGVYISGPWHCYCCKIDGQTPVPGQIGDIIDYGPMNGSFGPNNYEILTVSPGLPTSWQGNMYSTPYCCADPVPCMLGGCIDPCDTTPGSPCAIQWFQNPNATWASNWINNRDCSNYTWPSINLEVQALTIMAAAPNPQPNIYNNASDIWAAGNNSNLPTSPVNLKAQFIAKMAKARYSQCQKVDCNC